MENINNIYFDGYYKEVWRTMIPAELTVKETEFMIRHFNLLPGHKVLDLMCGYGRHAIALAQKQMVITAVDNLQDYIDEIDKAASQDNLPISAIREDIVKYQPEGLFDLAICMGNSLCFFERADTVMIIQKIGSSLKKNGHFLINTWMLAEIAFNGFTQKTWAEVADLKFINDSQYLLQPSRIETDTLILSPDGVNESKKAIDYIYSIAEMELILHEAGFIMKEVYSIPGRKKFTLGDPRAYIVAEKV